MALQIKAALRKFKFHEKKSETNIVLDDPNTKFTSEEVMSFYAGQYPQLTNGTISGPEMEDGNAVYKFKTSLGEKG